MDVDLLIRGTPDEVHAATRNLLHGVGRRNGYILSSGNIIMDETPRENVRAMMDACQRFTQRDG